jgi:hypothetical protein
MTGCQRRSLGNCPWSWKPARAHHCLHPRDAVASLIFATVLHRIRYHDSVRAALLDAARAVAATSASVFATLQPLTDALLHERAQAMMEPWPAWAGQGGNAATASANAFSAHHHYHIIVGMEQEEVGPKAAVATSRTLTLFRGAKAGSSFASTTRDGIELGRCHGLHLIIAAWSCRLHPFY